MDGKKLVSSLFFILIIFLFSAKSGGGGAKKWWGRGPTSPSLSAVPENETRFSRLTGKFPWSWLQLVTKQGYKTTRSRILRSIPAFPFL